MAPEVLERAYNEKCDVWSCGVLLFLLLSGNPPFDGEGDDVIFRKIMDGSYSLAGPEWDIISSEAKDLIAGMLEYNPKARLSAVDALHHPWMSNASHMSLDSR
jgi:calcium-dependent protein kinase